MAMMPMAPPGAAPPPMAPGAPPGAPSAAIMAALGRMRAPPADSLPGLGAQGDAVSSLANAVSMIQAALPGMAPGSEVHKAAIKAVQLLSPHLPSAGTGAGVPSLDQIARLAQSVRQNALLSHLMAQQGQGQPAPQMAPVTSPGG